MKTKSSGTATGLTEKEQEVMDHLVRAIQIYSELPIEHPNEPQEFLHSLHRLQDILAIRVVRRIYPAGWYGMSDPKLMKCDKCFSTNLKVHKETEKWTSYECQNCHCKQVVMKRKPKEKESGMVRAKFQVIERRSMISPEGGVEIRMTPVSADGNPENEIFGKYTPSGEVRMLIIGDAANEFELGKFYYVDFTQAEE